MDYPETKPQGRHSAGDVFAMHVRHSSAAASTAVLEEAPPSMANKRLRRISEHPSECGSPICITDGMEARFQFLTRGQQLSVLRGLGHRCRYLLLKPFPQRKGFRSHLRSGLPLSTLKTQATYAYPIRMPSTSDCDRSMEYQSQDLFRVGQTPHMHAEASRAVPASKHAQMSAPRNSARSANTLFREHSSVLGSERASAHLAAVTAVSLDALTSETLARVKEMHSKSSSYTPGVAPSRRSEGSNRSRSTHEESDDLDYCVR